MLSQFIPCFIYSYDLRLFLFLYAHMLMIHNCVTNVLTISPPDATHRLQQPPPGADKNLPLLQSSLLPCPLLNKSAAGVELPVFCIHLFFIQTSCVSGVFPFLVYVYFSSLPFLIIVSIGKICLVTMKSVLSVLFPSVQRHSAVVLPSFRQKPLMS